MGSYSYDKLNRQTTVQDARGGLITTVYNPPSCTPIGFDAADTNLYRYVGNEPTNAKDPRGLLRLNDFELGVFVSKE